MTWMKQQSVPSTRLLMMRLGGVVDAPEGSAATQQDPDRLERWVQRHLVKFNKDKCRILNLRKNNLPHQDRYEAALGRKTWGPDAPEVTISK
ncbi:hypothetical protein HGM15179_002491 [Zosterops borbonicus]|uniref:Rna-directed dna polymerase from mobile element jockey-like n=1 Tax=Zosterops borbonicus TaxID=364589 RepID=A0A8K1LSE5_9PASS|nr:hypothetical protein HGM15179_002491 [Zosterops borbonicus]